MECPNTYHPKLSKREEFWKKVQEACLQTFSSIQWQAGKSHWYFPVCKSHIFQAVLRKALATGEGDSEFIELMKRGQEAESAALYAFSIDPALGYRLTSGETEFLRKLNLEEFITSNAWGVLHTQLATEAIASLDPHTFWTTVNEKKIQIIAKEWREQFQNTFHLTKKEPHPVAQTWQLTELFPSLKEATETTEIVKISDCQHPDARRPLRLLSSLFCLNPTHHNQLALAFVEMVVAALNGLEADWPQEFYCELTEELTTLHNKTLATKVRVEKTSIGPHLTLILKAGGLLNIKEELEAGYRSEKGLTLEEQLPFPKKSRTKPAKEVPETQATVRLVQPRPKATATRHAPQPTTAVYSVAAQQATTSPQKRVVLETTEKRQPPNALPTMVEQICQAHRRLENLLFSFTSKAPQKLVNQVNDQFFKIQREATLREGMETPPEGDSDTFLKFQDVQLKQLAKRLENAENLNEVNIETIFRLQEEVIAVQNKLAQSEEEVLFLKGRKGEAISTGTSPLIAQITKLEARLTNAEELIDLYVENSFETQTLLAEQDEEMTSLKMEVQAVTDGNRKELNALQEKLTLAEEEVLGLRSQKGEALHQIGQLRKEIDNHAQQMRGKDEEITDLSEHIADLNGHMTRQDALEARRRDEILRLESQITEHQQHIAQLKEDKCKLGAENAAGQEAAYLHQPGGLAEGNPESHPILGREKQTMSTGVASKLLNELQRDLARTRQEKTDLAQKLTQKQEEFRKLNMPHAATHSSAELFQQIMSSTRPGESIMHYHRGYGGLNLIISNIPLLKLGCNLDFHQIQEIWGQANAAARDTLVFMWTLGDLKTPLGVMEVLTGSPPFYIRRYVLRCIKLLGQHHNMARSPRESLPTLKSYSHGQYHAIKKLQQSKPECFHQALTTLAAEDTAICFEAVQQYQALTNKHPNSPLQPTLSQLKDFVNATLEAQQTTLNTKRFGHITSGTLRFQPRSSTKDQEADQQSMGTCFL
jgi:hypothetical protein